MDIQARVVELPEIEPLRERYRQEMDCQIIHDSIHARPGWTREYSLTIGHETVGYGSLAVAGPWEDSPTIYEYYVLPGYRTRIFDLFAALLASSGVRKIETQSNGPLLTSMLHTFSDRVTSESILFQDGLTTSHSCEKVCFRPASPEDAAQLERQQLDPGAKWLLESEDQIAAAGDILFHYNRPYGDIYMKVADPNRGRGFGAYLVQELKRVCREGGSVPAARCRVKNVASRKTLQKAGFVPCGHLLTGTVAR